MYQAMTILMHGAMHVIQAVTTAVIRDRQAIRIQEGGWTTCSDCGYKRW